MADYTFDSPSGQSPMINYRKDAKKGVKFTFMVVGELGTGKTTFINCLLNKKVLLHRYEADSGTLESNAVGDTRTLTFTSAKSVALPNTSILTKNRFEPEFANEEPGIALTETKVEMVDDLNQKLLLNIIDAPGFGDNLNNEMCFVEIESYLKQQFDLVLAEETRIRRNPRFVDTRVHVLLYFITPTGHGLRETDIVCMKRLAKYVNIIPVIGKADTFTETELKHFKQQIMVDIEKFNVPIFQFDNYLNEYDEEEDYELIQECKYLAKIQPFAVVLSESLFEVKDTTTGATKTIRARQYPWGLVDVENPTYSDFPVLKSVLLGSHLQDLKDLTHDFLYETYRTERLTKVTGGAVDDYGDDYNNSTTNATADRNGSEYANGNVTVPSLLNLAQLTNSTANGGALDDDAGEVTADITSVASAGSKQKSMLLDDTDNNITNDHIATPRHQQDDSFGSVAGSMVSLDQSINTQKTNTSFKRLSIGPQRNQLRQISETVPYVLRHERILERQQKLEEMEMASAKELAARAALLEQKAAQLKAKEKILMKQLDKEQAARRLREQEDAISKASEAEEETDREEDLEDVAHPSEAHGNGHHAGTHLKKDATLTDLHSVVEQR